MASRIAVMIDGAVAQFGTPKEIYDRPTDVRVAQFIGTPRMNLLPGELTGGAVRLAGISQPPGQCASASDGPVRIGLRPEHIGLTAPGPGAFLSGIVRHVEFLGSETLVHVLPSGVPAGPAIVVRVSPDTAELLARSVVGLGLAPDVLHLFDSTGCRHRSRPAIGRGGAFPRPARPDDDHHGRCRRHAGRLAVGAVRRRAGPHACCSARRRCAVCPVPAARVSPSRDGIHRLAAAPAISHRLTTSNPAAWRTAYPHQHGLCADGWPASVAIGVRLPCWSRVAGRACVFVPPSSFRLSRPPSMAIVKFLLHPRSAQLTPCSRSSRIAPSSNSASTVPPTLAAIGVV